MVVYQVVSPKCSKVVDADVLPAEADALAEAEQVVADADALPAKADALAEAEQVVKKDALAEAENLENLENLAEAEKVVENLAEADAPDALAKADNNKVVTTILNKWVVKKDVETENLKDLKNLAKAENTKL